MQPVQFVPLTASPTHFGAFRPSGIGYVYDLRGCPFLTNELAPNARIIAEAAWGADIYGNPNLWTWSDFTARIMFTVGITITQGRADETSTTQPASCGFNLLNDDASYSAYNPMSPNYPFVRRNTPIRISIDPGAGVPIVVFQGEAASWTPAWDTKCAVPIVKVQAAGIMRRLGQGKTPLDSALTHSISLNTATVAAWPMEDLAGSSQFASSIAGGQPMTFAGDMTLANNSLVIGSGPLPTFGSATTMSAPGVKTPSGTWTLSWYSYLAATPAANTTIMSCQTDGTIRRWDVIVGAGLVTINGTDLTGALVVNESFTATGAFGAALHWHLSAQVVAGTLTWSLVWASLDDTTIIAPTDTIAATSAGNITRIFVPMSSALSGYVLGQVGIFDAYNFGFAIESAGNGYLAEFAGVRWRRLADENGIQRTQYGAATAQMGPQPITTPLAAIRECEAADGGVLFDGFGPGLVMAFRNIRYNAPTAITIDFAGGQLGVPFGPVDDDQRNRNDVTVSRQNGSSGRYVQETGPLGTATIGTYDTSSTVNVWTDDVLYNMAAWAVHLGTVEGLRYPALNLDIAAVPALALPWLHARDYGGSIGFRIDILNVTQIATQHPPGPVSVLAEGYTMFLNPKNWTIAVNCSSALPYRVAVVQDATNPWVVDSDDSGLHLNLNATDTSWLVDAGTLWTTTATNPQDFPVLVVIGGEEISVTGIVGTASPQTFTGVRSVNGVVTTHDAGDTVALYRPAVIEL